jgi:hypothetical protein
MIKLRLTQFWHPNSMPDVGLMVDRGKLAVLGMQSLANSLHRARATELQDREYAWPESRRMRTTGSARMGRE